VFPIGVPPLRQRTEDIPELTRHFLARIAVEEGKRVRAISGEALALLSAYRWPGNVRQLENTIFRAVVLADGEEVGINEFPQVTAQIEAQGANATTLQPALDHGPAMISSWPELSESLHGGALASAAPMMHLTDIKGEVRPLDDIERDVIRFAITHYRGQMSEVARRLKIGRSTLYRKLDGLGLEEENAADEAPVA
jgi:DNA-binding NtrC family response regulator